MTGPPEHDRLRLSREDAALLWGVVEGVLARTATQRWPRLERIKFDLEVMLAKGEPTRDGS